MAQPGSAECTASKSSVKNMWILKSDFNSITLLIGIFSIIGLILFLLQFCVKLVGTTMKAVRNVKQGNTAQLMLLSAHSVARGRLLKLELIIAVS